jgi:RNA-binding protein
MTLSSAQKKDYKRTGHHLKPVVTVSDQGASEGVLSELDRALTDHELIKIRVSVADRETRQALIAQVCKASGAELVQVIGKMAILLRLNRKANPKLSNLTRLKEI